MEELIIGDNCINGNVALRERAWVHFQNLYYEDLCYKPKLDNLNFSRLGDRNRARLEEKLTETENTDCLRDCDGDKAPGPDGFNFKFRQTFWGVIKYDIIEFFNDFHNHSSFVRSLNSIFLVMIPKKCNPKHINDFRPISLVGCIYKLLSKVLVERLSKVLNQIIGNCQHAFVYGCQICNAILIANETLMRFSDTTRLPLYVNLAWKKLSIMLTGTS